MKTVKIQRFPNGEVRFVMFTPVSRGDSSESSDETGETDFETDSEIPSYLTLSENSNRHTPEEELAQSPKAGYGALGRVPGYTPYARRRILRAGGAIDEVTSSPEECLFLTGTLPGGTDEAKKAIAEWSSYAVNLVQNWLGKRVSGKLLIYCWEFQKRGALHLHLTMVCKEKLIRESIISGWKSQWQRVIDNISAKSGVDCWQRRDGYSYANGNKSVLQTDAQECTKSAAAYLSKYMSKQNLQPENECEWKYHPARYWGVSRPLCRLTDELTETLEVGISRDYEAHELYEDVLSDMAETSESTYSYRHEGSGSKVAVSYSQKYKEELRWESLKTRVLETCSPFGLALMKTEALSQVMSSKAYAILSDVISIATSRQQSRWYANFMKSISRISSGLKHCSVYQLAMTVSSLIDLVCGSWLWTDASEILRLKMHSLRNYLFTLERTLNETSENQTVAT